MNLTRTRTALALAVLLAPFEARSAEAGGEEATPTRAEQVIVARVGTPDRLLSEAFVRLEAEIRLAGFEPESRSLGEEATPLAELQQLAQHSSALAALALVPQVSGTTIAVCISDHATGRLLLRSFPATETGSESPDLVALRAVESFRATLREFRFTERSPDPRSRAAPVPAIKPDRSEAVALPPPRAEAPARRFELRAAAAGLLAVNGSQPSLGPALALAWRPLRTWAARAVFVGPTIGANFASDRGVASLTQGLALLEGERLIFERGPLSVGLAVGAGAFYLRARGRPNAPALGLTSSVWALAGEAGIDVTCAVSSRVDLVGSVRGVYLTPQPVVSILDAEQATGRPSLVLALGAQVAL